MNTKITDVFLRLSYEIWFFDRTVEAEERKKNKPQTDAEVIGSEGKSDKLPDMGTGAEQDHPGKQTQQFYGAEVTLI